ncbi:RagB/SusD family nutrient uptake outer membrane protein [Algibacter pacificus]|uniref:RagB/SusD family nutrient uptake outer membrane protein n=1 Tax=Algibacter pacificus TaxID=2599389 RepID=UPI0011CAE409|nr:RagB/SusD family nutrient uptake outer membrane protein [Algibacter pacificus]
MINSNLISKLKHILFLFIALIIISCDEEFLNIPPKHFQTDGNFYQTEDDFEQAITAVYSALQKYVGSAYILEETRSDNTMPDQLLDGGQLGGGPQLNFIDRFTMDSGASPVNAAWSTIYDAIKDINFTLSFLKDADLNEDFINRTEGELKFFRAYFHFIAVRYWGDTPLVLKPITSPEQAFAISRTSVDTVYEAIISDTNFAISNLPTSYSGTNIGKVNQWAARMLLAKVYLTKHDYPNAQSQLNHIIESKQYRLLNDYAAVFDPSNKNHAESIFEAQFKEGPEGESSRFIYSFAPLNSRGVIVVGPDGGGGRNIPTNSIVNAYEANDLRKNISIAFFDRTPSPVWYIKKYDNDSDPEFARTPDNWPIYRYADVLLMQAETINEQAYQTDIPFKLLNKVRTRAGLPALTPTDLPNQEAFRKAIAKERRVELAFENHRWFDLVRTGKAVEVMTAHGKEELANPTMPSSEIVSLEPESYIITAEELLYPIPIRELEVSTNLQPQNTGY